MLASQVESIEHYGHAYTIGQDLEQIMFTTVSSTGSRPLAFPYPIEGVQSFFFPSTFYAAAVAALRPRCHPTV